ncbi:MAG TPA: DUF1028 domain-containing protein [Vicinamibacteria bacterium]|nr:DUF1028 domain-containing protein [Vicinamibacteria bacterium]
MHVLVFVLGAVLAGPPAAAAVRPARPVHTYSIVARDARTGELGVAVQSHWFSVGAVVPWAEAGVGAVATQSFVDASYGPLGLALMRGGRTAPQALAALLAADDQRDVRQVGMVDARGNVATFTGRLDIPAAGGLEGEGYVVQANLMEKATVWPAMARAYEAAEGDLALRLLAALDAAEAEGGDIRGRQSAALLVVKGASSGRPWADRVFDLRVEDSPEPLRELRRLVGVQRAYNHMTAGDDCVALKDWACAEREYGAAQAMQPENAEMAFWHAVALVTGGRMEAAKPLFQRAFAADRRWRELVRRLPDVGQLPDDPKVLEVILALP